MLLKEFLNHVSLDESEIEVFHLIHIFVNKTFVYCGYAWELLENLNSDCLNLPVLKISDFYEEPDSKDFYYYVYCSDNKDYMIQR